MSANIRRVRVSLASYFSKQVILNLVSLISAIICCGPACNCDLVICQSIAYLQLGFTFSIYLSPSMHCMEREREIEGREKERKKERRKERKKEKKRKGKKRKERKKKRDSKRERERVEKKRSKKRRPRGQTTCHPSATPHRCLLETMPR